MPRRLSAQRRLCQGKGAGEHGVVDRLFPGTDWHRG